MNPTVSVIIPTKNRAKLLPRAINSIIAQTFKDFEIIIIDGHSTDDTQEVIRKYNDNRIRCYLQEVNNNGAQATNEGIERAKGKYIAFLDDDDEWLPEKLEKQVRLLDSLSNEYGMVYCWMDYYDDFGKSVHQTHPVLKGYIFKDILVDEKISGTPTFLVRKSVIEQIGGFDTELIYFDDAEFARRVAKNYKIDLIQEPLVKVYTNHGSIRQSDMTYLASESLVYIFNKYKDDLNKDLFLKSQFFTKCAYSFSISKNIHSFIKYSFFAIKSYPFSLGKYRTLSRGILNFFK
jgi:glycosyltransferase involved in cell wall biosynthesis